MENKCVTQDTFDEDDEYSEWNPRPIPIEELEANIQIKTSQAKISEKKTY